MDHQFKRRYDLTPSKSGSSKPSSASKSVTYSSRFVPINALDKSYSPNKKIKLNSNDSQKPAFPSTISPLYERILESELAPKSSTIMSFGSPNKNKPINRLLFPSSSVTSEKFQSLPLSKNTLDILTGPRQEMRSISKTPFKVLDAPDLQDDFYLNLVDWSNSNILGVGLGSCVYLWSACTSKVTKLCDLGPQDTITSVSWCPKGTQVAVGTHCGYVQLWDIKRNKKIRQFAGHQARIGCMAWNVDCLTTGSRDRTIFNRDVRSPRDFVQQLQDGHRQEVCGLRWSYEETILASGGNDNRLLLWDKRHIKPFSKCADHTAAIKALAWSPHQSGVLASGGGTADRHITFRNAINGQILSSIDTGSQVCNIAYSKTDDEIVSTHGYSQNQICVWKVKDMNLMATLTGHSTRVLYLAASPDGQNIVSGAGDETLRFWNVFNKIKPQNEDRGLRLVIR